MYKSRQFYSHWELTDFLNEQHIAKDKIIQITYCRREYNYSTDADYYTIFYME